MLPPINAVLAADPAVTAKIGSAPMRCFAFAMVPEGTALPYVAWYTSGGSPENVMGGTPPHDATICTFEIWADSSASLLPTYTAVRNAVERLGNIISFNPDDYNPATGRLVMSFDAEFHVMR